MGRKSTGTVRVLTNDEGRKQWHAKWTRADGTRTPWLPIDPSIPLDDEVGAKACAARLAPKVKAASANGGKGETIDAFVSDVFDAREAEGKTSVGRERRMWKARISPKLGALAVADVSKEQIEDFRDYLRRRGAQAHRGRQG
jgi:hypothetical protein